MRWCISLLFVFLSVSNSYALINYGNGTLGVYFDIEGEDVMFEDPPPNSVFTAYVILKSPDPLELSGIDFGYSLSGDPSLYFISESLPEGATNYGDSTNYLHGNFNLVFDEPLPPASHIVIVTWDYFSFGGGSIEYYLGGETIDNLPEGRPIIYSGDNCSQEIGIPSLDPTWPVAFFGEHCGSLSGCIHQPCTFSSPYPIRTNPTALDSVEIVLPFRVAVESAGTPICVPFPPVSLHYRFNFPGSSPNFRSAGMQFDWNDGSEYRSTLLSNPTATSLDYYISIWDEDSGQTFRIPNLCGADFRRIPGVQPQWNDIASGAIPFVGNSIAIAWGDYDNDGDEDLYVVRPGIEQPNVLLANNGNGQFMDCTPVVLGDIGIGTDASWGDFDNDGDLDLLVVNSTGENLLCENFGQGSPCGQFSEVQIGDGLLGVESVAAAWVDYDHNGQIEAYISNRDGSNQLLQLPLDWTSEIPEGLDLFGPSQGFGWCDFNLDMKPGLYLVDETSNHHLFEQNQDGTFDVTALEESLSGQGCSWGDYDNDGDFDLFITYWGHDYSLLENHGEGQFREVECSTFETHALGQGSAWGDFDNDGYLDLYVATYSGQNEMFHNENGTGQFQLVLDPGFPESTHSIGTAWADMDNDGDLDLYVCNDGEPDNLFQNNQYVSGNWLKVKLVGTQSNAVGLGAIIEVKAGDLTLLRYVAGGTGYSGQNSLVQHFGLGDVTSVDEVTVTWPFKLANGEHHTSVLSDISCCRTITITEEVNTSSVAESDQLPQAIDLHACFPNPFNPQTTIAFDLPKQAAVSLRVYDVSGRLVDVLLDDEVANQGRNEAVWNGRDAQGQTVSAGIYFYRLEAGDYSETKRMALIK
jgi:FG-GAP-like repeat/ASPIC and UnbV/Secretion system C-terminal sorting domain